MKLLLASILLLPVGGYAVTPTPQQAESKLKAMEEVLRRPDYYNIDSMDMAYINGYCWGLRYCLYGERDIRGDQ